jgi:hypothetical protein
VTTLLLQTSKTDNKALDLDVIGIQRVLEISTLILTNDSSRQEQQILYHFFEI